ncbi:MAG TPA: hypothetical protein VF743_05760 [Acidimicrobiales bacterium]
MAVMLALADSTVSLIIAVLSAMIAVLSLAWQARTDRQQRREDRQAEADRLVRRYREPLVFAADQLSSRILNIQQNGFLRKYGGVRRDYVRHSTAFAIAEMLGWMELLREDQQLLDLGEVEETRRLNRCLLELGRRISTDSITGPDGRPASFMLWRQEQRAIGEVMIDRSDGTARCLGYARFVARLDDQAFGQWFERLLADIDTAIDAAADADPVPSHPRLRAVRESAEALIAHLDPDAVRVPRDAHGNRRYDDEDAAAPPDRPTQGWRRGHQAGTAVR